MSVLAITAKFISRLNRLAGRDLALGTRLEEFEAYGVLAHSYGNANAAKTYAAADLPIAPVVRITLTAANAAADLVLPAATNKLYVIYNNSGQTITAKVTGQTGIALANGGKYLIWSNGTDIVCSVPEVTLNGAETLTNKTLTAPAVTSPNTTEATASHDYAGAAVDWTLSAAELKCGILVATNAIAAVNAIFTPTAGKVYVVKNTSGQALTVKAAGQTGVVIASTKKAIVMGNGTDIERVSGDS